MVTFTVAINCTISSTDLGSGFELCCVLLTNCRETRDSQDIVVRQEGPDLVEAMETEEKLEAQVSRDTLVWTELRDSLDHW